MRVGDNASRRGSEGLAAPLRLAYVSASTLPSKSANSVHVTRMASALALHGASVTLFARNDFDSTLGLDSYGLHPAVHVEFCEWPPLRGVGGLVYGRRVASRIAHQGEFDAVYGRDLYSLWWLRDRGLPYGYEVHDVGAGGLRRRLELGTVTSPSCRAVVSISEVLARDTTEVWKGHSHAPIHTLPDGADPMEQGAPTRASDERRRFRVGYAGSLHAGKGMEMILELARALPDFDFEVLGGHADAIRTWQARSAPRNLHFLGWKPHVEVAPFLRSCDVLVAPYGHRVAVDGGRGDVARWMSPLKLFEYMAARVPIVTSDLPVIAEVVENERNGLLCDAGSIDAWVGALKRLESDALLRDRLAGTAERDLRERFSWSVRAGRVLELLGP